MLESMRAILANGPNPSALVALVDAAEQADRFGDFRMRWCRREINKPAEQRRHLRRGLGQRADAWRGEHDADGAIGPSEVVARSISKNRRAVHVGPPPRGGMLTNEERVPVPTAAGRS